MAHYAYIYSEPQTWPPYYVSDPWRTTAVPHHFPEHHYPLEHTRHSLGRTLSNIGHAIVHPWESDQPVYSPRADIQESERAYYLDVELPGVKGADAIKLKWLSSRTLLLETKVQRPLTGEEAPPTNDKSAEGKTDEAGAKATDETGAEPLHRVEKHEESADATKPQPQQKVFLTLKERQIGTYARAFSFPTAVDHATLVAHLENGLCRLKVPKILDAPVKDEHKTPEVKEGPKKDEKAKI